MIESHDDVTGDSVNKVPADQPGSGSRLRTATFAVDPGAHAAPAKPDAAEVVTELLAREPVGETREYLRFHQRRYVLLVEQVDAGITSCPSDHPRLLDVGPSFQTRLFRELLGVPVDTLGFEPGVQGPRAGEQHIQFNLNDAHDRSRWPAGAERYDLVVLAEVLEHLYCAPQEVLTCLRSLMKDGSRLILQTPNGVSLHHRLVMASGRNPFEMIRMSRTNPGHFREYTRSELTAVLEGSGFRVESHVVSNYFGDRTSRRSVVYDLICGLLPESFRDGITTIATAVPDGS